MKCKICQNEIFPFSEHLTLCINREKNDKDAVNVIASEVIRYYCNQECYGKDSIEVLK